MTAAIYLGRARLRPVLIDKGTAGGQMVLSYEVANYPGVETASGREISQTMLRQARHFGADIELQATTTSMDLERDIKRVEVEDEGTFEAPVVIVAAGGRPRSLGLESEARFAGQGISYCATCDGDFFTDKSIVVVGGGNSALEEAVSLTKYASSVTVLHLLDEFQAQPWAVEQALRNPKVTLQTGHEVARFEGEGSLERVIVRDVHSGEQRSIPAEGCFVFIGYEPNTEAFRGVVATNERGEILADEQMRTSVPGVYVAGDSREKRFRQITTAVSDGTIAAMSAIEELTARQRRAPAIGMPSHGEPLRSGVHPAIGQGVGDRPGQVG